MNYQHPDWRLCVTRSTHGTLYGTPHQPLTRQLIDFLGRTQEIWSDRNIDSGSASKGGPPSDVGEYDVHGFAPCLLSLFNRQSIRTAISQTERFIVGQKLLSARQDTLSPAEWVGTILGQGSPWCAKNISIRTETSPTRGRSASVKYQDAIQPICTALRCDSCAHLP